MRKIVTQAVGLAVIGFAVYVAVQCILILANYGDRSWSDIQTPLIIVGVFILLVLIGNTSKNKTVSEGTEQQPKNTTLNKTISTENLECTVYQQHDKTWWLDNDGDQHEGESYHATLRFYEDGTVIGIRSEQIPHLADEKSFTLKGHWEQNSGQIELELTKTQDVEESINPVITAEERRQMKYAGHISNNESLIYHGKYKGEVIEGALHLGNHTLYKPKLLTLIITTTDELSERICKHFTNHPLILAAFTDAGHWYTNGETGKEWFTVHLRAPESNQQAVEQALDAYLLLEDDGVGNRHWAW